MAGVPFELREAFDDGNLIIVVGPALSVAAGLPDSAGLASALLELARAQELHVDHERLSEWIARGRSAEVLGLLERRLGQRFTREVERRLSDQSANIPALARAIAELGDGLRAVYSTNLDRLLERAFADRWPSFSMPRADLAQRRGVLFKLCGTLEFPQSWVLTRERQEQELGPRSLRRAVFESAFAAHKLLFVGFAPGAGALDMLLDMVEASGAGEHFMVVERCAVEEREALERRGLEVLIGEPSEVLRALAPGAARADEAGPAFEGLPFPGLEAFAESDARLFFGRQAEISQAASRLGGLDREHCYWLAIEGPSGVGKSSFARAGVLPALRRGFGVGTPASWRVAIMRPGRRPSSNLTRALREALDGSEHESLDELCVRLPARGHGEHGVLLLVDQLEELATIAQGDERDQFSDRLARLVADGRLYLVTTLRSDFVPGVQVVAPELAGLLNEKAERYALPPISRVGLREAIVAPARLCGARINADVVERLVSDAEAVGGDSEGDDGALTRASTLPLVAHVLRVLWDAGAFDDDIVELHEYEAIGGVAGALSHSADAVLDALSEDQREQARRLLLSMVRVNAGARETRKTIARSEAVAIVGEPLLLKLSGVGDEGREGVRLLVAHTDGEQPQIDLVHEAVLRDWDTLAGWIAEERGQLLLDAELERQAQRWHERGRPRLGLPGGADAAGLLRGNPRGPGQDIQRAYQTTLRWLGWARRGLALGVTLGAIVVALVLARLNRQVEDQNRRLLEHQQALEDEKREQRAALSRQRGTQARMLIPSDREGEALALGVAAVGAYGPEWTEAPPREALEGLAHVLVDDAVVVRPSVTLSEHEGTIYSIVYAPDGTRFASSSFDGSARLWSAEGEAIAALEDHEDRVIGIAFSPDGAQLASASYDRSVKIWSADTGELIDTLGAHEGGVLWVAFSPDGARLAASDVDRTVVWDAATRELLPFVLEGPGYSRRSLAYTADGTGLVTGGLEAGRIWDASSGALVRSLSGHRGEHPRVKVALSPDGSRAATYSRDEVRIWDLATSQVVSEFVTPEPFKALSYSPDGSQLAVGSEGGTINVWSADEGELIATFSGHDDAVYGLSYSPDGAQLATGSQDTTVRLWAPSSATHLATLDGHRHTVGALAYAPDGDRITTGSYDKTVRIWEPELDRPLTPVRGHSSFLRVATFSYRGDRVATCGNDGTVKIWEPESGELLTTLVGHTDRVGWIAWSPASVRIASASEDNSARIWDPELADALVVLEGHEDDVYGVVYSPDGARVATASADGTARVWDPSTGEELHRFDGHEATLSSIEFLPDGRRVLSASFDATARLWDATSGQELDKLEGHGGGVWSAMVSPDRAHVLTTSKDETARIWDLVNHREPIVLEGHDDEVMAGVFRPDGRQVATASYDGTAMLWNAETGAREQLLAGHQDKVYTVSYSPDGARVVTASADETARVWSASTGEQAFALTLHRDEVTIAGYSPDGTRIVTASEDDTAKVWDAETGELVADLTDVIKLRRADGTLEWPIPPRTLTRIGCERLVGFEDEYAGVAAICDPLLGQ